MTLPAVPVPLLTSDMVDFLGAGLAHQVGACRPDGTPCLSRALAADVEADGRVLVLLSAAAGFEVLDAIRATARVAVNFTSPATFHSLHLKGTDAMVGPAGTALRDLLERRHASFRANIVPLGFPAEYSSSWYDIADDDIAAIRFTPTAAWNQTPVPAPAARWRCASEMHDADAEVSLFGVRRMLEGVVPPAMCSVSADGMPHVNYLSLAEYVDADHLALSFQFFNQSRANVLATGRASLSLDDPYTGAGVVMQLVYVRTESEGPIFERLRAKLAGVASHTGMEKVFHLRGADVYRVLALRRVPGRRELPAAQPRCDLAAGARVVSERMAASEELSVLLDALMNGLDEQLRIDHAMLWLLDDATHTMTLLASHGYPERSTGAEFPLGDGLAGIAAREGVPIRIGHMAHMTIYGRAVRSRASELGLDPLLGAEMALPGLADPRSQLAVPLRARGRVLGVLFVESEHDQYFGYDDEDALTTLCGQFAMALTLMRTSPEVEAPRDGPAPPVPEGEPLRVRYYEHDGSVFLDGEYLIKGVAGAIFWKLVRDPSVGRRGEFTTRELRLAREELHLPDVQDNLDVRLLLLQRRLAEREAPVRIERAGRGRFRLLVRRPLQLVEAAGGRSDPPAPA